MANVQLSGVQKTYPNGAIAVRGVDMAIEDGEFIVFVGPSGCGKSTLLRMIAGLETISEGEINIDDRLINDVSPADRDVAMVFQNYALYPHMTVRGNMSYGLKNRGLPKAEIKQKVEDAASLLRISDFLDRQPNPTSFPADSANAWQWGELSYASLRFFCLMNHCQTWMPSYAFRCASRLNACNGD